MGTILIVILIHILIIRFLERMCIGPKYNFCFSQMKRKCRLWLKCVVLIIIITHRISLVWSIIAFQDVRYVMILTVLVLQKDNLGGRQYSFRGGVPSVLPARHLLR